jgi:hypothetical protein
MNEILLKIKSLKTKTIHMTSLILQFWKRITDYATIFRFTAESFR